MPTSAASLQDDTSPELIERLLAIATRHETPCGDGSLVWHVWGQPHAEHPPLVLLHGGSGSWTHWVRNIAPLMQTGRQLFVPDLPGFGASALSPLGRDADALPTPLEEGLRLLLDRVGGGGHQAVDLAGFSFGGLTGGLWTAAHPERVRRLVLCGAPGLGLASRRAVELTGWRHLADPAEVEAVHRKNLKALMFADTASITPLALRLHMQNVVRDRMPGRRLAYSDALLRALREVACPVFAIYGEADALYVGKMEDVRGAFENAADFRGMVLVEGAGHWVQFERAGLFDEALLGVLGNG